ncbi:hypothetical protein GCM10009602_06940 [Nocardiopsis tropica]
MDMGMRRGGGSFRIGPGDDLQFHHAPARARPVRGVTRRTRALRRTALPVHVRGRPPYACGPLPRRPRGSGGANPWNSRVSDLPRTPGRGHHRG